MRLKDKVAIVTGGASGIGAAIAGRFVEEGASVVVADSAASDEAAALTGNAAISRYKIDVSDQASTLRLVETLLKALPRIDILVNSAGIGRNIPFLETPVDVFDRVLAVNLRGTFLMSQAVGRAMAASGGGRIINIGSISGHRGNLGRTAYGASKGGVANMSRVMAIELARYKILVNVIAPGPVETPLIAQMVSPEERRRWSARLPLGRYGTVDEIAAAALFLASDEASFITGQVLAVDGGFLAGGVIDQD